MIPTLRSCTFTSHSLDSGSASSLIDAKHRALAILHDCQNIVASTVQIFNQLASLPGLSELKYRQPSSEEWLACAIKSLIEADTPSSGDGVNLERYAVTALENASRQLMHQKGLSTGYQAHATEAAKVLEANRQKAKAANAKKGEATRQAIISRIRAKFKENGNYHGIYADVAREMDVTPARVSQVWKKYKPKY